MEQNGQVANPSADGAVLEWAGRVVSAEALRRSLNGHRELVLRPNTVLTPLALEHLRERGVQVTRRGAPQATRVDVPWGYAEDRPHPLVQSVVNAVARDGVDLQRLDVPGQAEPERWAQAAAQCIADGTCRGGVVFCADPGLVCCVANKQPGLRAAAVTSVAQAARAGLALGANLVAVEVAGRSFFELRQIVKTLCGQGAPACPPGVACLLEELDGHAHR